MENYPCYPFFLSGALDILLSTPMGVDYVVIGFDMEVTTISYPQCSLTFMRVGYLHRCREQSFAIPAYAMSVVGIDVVSIHKLFVYTVSTHIVSIHTKYCRIPYGITR